MRRAAMICVCICGGVLPSTVSGEFDWINKRMQWHKPNISAKEDWTFRKSQRKHPRAAKHKYDWKPKRGVASRHPPPPARLPSPS